ncbi:MAG: hypothetical protein E6H09_14370 [Bacteroidetes bacterium]|jgi:hypothetical protein|nr:MAG: hypothetical protein E6H09_14370 [Bacteroidota bacterium]
MQPRVTQIVRFLLLMSLLFSLRANAQDNNLEFCRNLLTIHKFISEKRQSDTTIVTPVGLLKSKSDFVANSRSTRNRAYYTCLIKLPNQLVSEFKKESGKFDYIVNLGAYSTKASADKAGQKLKATILGCVDKSKWKTTAVEGPYLAMSYLPRDISLSLTTIKKADGKFEIRLALITFGNL